MNLNNININISKGFDFEDDPYSFYFDKMQDIILKNNILISSKHNKIDNNIFKIPLNNIGIKKNELIKFKEYLNENCEDGLLFHINDNQYEFKPSIMIVHDNYIKIEITLDDITKNELKYNQYVELNINDQLKSQQDFNSF